MIIVEKEVEKCAKSIFTYTLYFIRNMCDFKLLIGAILHIIRSVKS